MYNDKSLINNLEMWMLDKANGENAPISKYFKIDTTVGEVAVYYEAAFKNWCPSWTPVITENNFTYGHYTQYVEPTRMQILRKRKPDQICAMMLRYASIALRGGNFLSIPRTVYASLVKEFNADIEGFAMPLNSQMLFLDKPFCSLFIDTDGPFGSIGSFFEQNFEKKTVICNPPFMDDIINKMLEFILKFKNSVFILCLPNHTDKDWYTICEQHASEKRVLPANTYSYQNQDDVFIANFPSVLFVIGKTAGRLQNIKWA